MKNITTEAFILRTEDLKKAKKEIYNEDTKDFLDSFVDIKSLDDLIGLYIKHPGYKIFENFPVWTLRVYKILEPTRKVLRMFGHTEDEIDSFENLENQKRKELRENSEDFKKIIGYSTAEFLGSGEELVKWLKKNGIQDYRYEI